jgi:hypothetical protein
MFQASIGPIYQLSSVFTEAESLRQRQRIMLDLRIRNKLMRMGFSLLSKCVLGLRIRDVKEVEWGGHTVQRAVEDCETQHEEAGS